MYYDIIVIKLNIIKFILNISKVDGQDNNYQRWCIQETGCTEG